MTITINHRSLIYTSLLGVFIAASLIVPLFSNNASAIDPSAVGFNAGNIIDDDVMTSSSTMTQAQIQAFLKSKNSCDNTNLSVLAWHDATSGYMTDSKGNKYWYDLSNGHFLCMADDTFNGQTAAQIIWQAAQTYNINPQVLIVVLQKEQGLVTDTWPNNIQYQSATGYGCPDGAACDSQYFGLSNQVNWTAKMYHAIETASPTWYTPYLVGNNYIQYNPSTSCGGSTVNIQNRATQALYNYTPYQPNAATLDAPMGATVTCGAYGNLNFYRYFTQWFGSTHAHFTSLDTPRWMQLSTATSKINPTTGQVIGDQLAVGTQLQLVDKIYIDGIWYLRTAADSASNTYAGIPQQDFSDIQPVPLDGPRYMEITSSRNKWNPVTGFVDTSITYPLGTQFKFVAKILVNGSWFYQAATDQAAGDSLYITASAVSEIPYVSFDTPRYMQVASATNQVNPVNGTQAAAVAAGTQTKFSSKIFVNGLWYFRTDSDTASNAPEAIPSTAIMEIPYQNIGQYPTWMLLTQGTLRYQPSAQTSVDGTYVDQNQQVLLSQQITINGTEYYRTAWNEQHGQDLAIPTSYFQSIPFVSLETPRDISLRKPAQKVDPYTGQAAGATFPIGYTLPYATKVYVNGIWYLRTQSDTTNGVIRGIPIDMLNAS